MEKKPIQFGVMMRGMAMGMAEVVPGVSGGTIAFITGIYERLLLAIKSFDKTFFSYLFKGKLQSAFRYVDGFFLLALIIGMMTGIVVAVFTVSYLLENYPPAVWAFFFGLIVGSAIYVLKQIPKWSILLFVILMLSTLAAYLIVQSVPAHGSTNLLFVFVSGAIAICALMLPGISGSFILLLMGMYKYVTGTLKDLLVNFSMDKLYIMVVFGLGCLTGMAVFSRVLTWTFKHYKLQTLAALSGFMIGSLWKIWPWRVPTSWMDEEGTVFRVSEKPFPFHTDHVKILAENNVFPGHYDVGSPLLTAVCLAAVFGFVLVFAIDGLGSKQEKSA